MAIFWVRRVGNVLHADGDVSNAELSKLPFGKTLHVEVKQPRRAKHHRLYWEMVNRIADAIGAEPENVSDTLKIATGHATVVKTKTHGTLYLPKSISFAAMDQTAFNAFFDKCLIIIKTEWGIARSDILESLGDLIEGDVAA